MKNSLFQPNDDTTKILISSLHTGGTEQQTQAIIDSLQEMGWNVEWGKGPTTFCSPNEREKFERDFAVVVEKHRATEYRCPYCGSSLVTEDTTRDNEALRCADCDTRVEFVDAEGDVSNDIRRIDYPLQR